MILNNFGQLNTDGGHDTVEFTKVCITTVAKLQSDAIKDV